MTQIIINTNGRTPNIDAMEACIEFITTNYLNRNVDGYKSKRIITTKKRNFTVEVEESPHTDKKSPCSVVFNIKAIR